MPYVDAFVAPVPKSKVQAYREVAEKLGAVWREHGALDYREWIADDVKTGAVTSFPQSVLLKEDEVVVFGWILYESRAHRDEVNARVMVDPRLTGMGPDAMPFDGKRMFFGGFSELAHIPGDRFGG